MATYFRVLTADACPQEQWPRHLRACAQRRLQPFTGFAAHSAIGPMKRPRIPARPKNHRRAEGCCRVGQPLKPDHPFGRGQPAGAPWRTLVPNGHSGNPDRIQTGNPSILLSCAPGSLTPVVRRRDNQTGHNQTWKSLTEWFLHSVTPTSPVGCQVRRTQCRLFHGRAVGACC